MLCDVCFFCSFMFTPFPFSVSVPFRVVRLSSLSSFSDLHPWSCYALPRTRFWSRTWTFPLSFYISSVFISLDDLERGVVKSFFPLIFEVSSLIIDCNLDLTRLDLETTKSLKVDSSWLKWLKSKLFSEIAYTAWTITQEHVPAKVEALCRRDSIKLQ